MAGIIYGSNEHKALKPLLTFTNLYIKAFVRAEFKGAVSDYQLKVLRANECIDCERCTLLFYPEGPNVKYCSRSCSSAATHRVRMSSRLTLQREPYRLSGGRVAPHTLLPYVL